MRPSSSTSASGRAFEHRSPPPPESGAPDPEAPEAAREQKLKLIRKRWSRRRVGATGFLVLLLLVLVAGATVRLGVLTDPGRAMVARLIDGQKIGRLGRLRIEGIEGDVFGAFRLKRLALVDSRGVWLQAEDLAMRWRPSELIARRVHAERLTARVLQIRRQPALSPPSEPGGDGGVSVKLDDVRLRLETLPALTSRLGIWDVVANADIRRRGGASGKLDAQSRLHAGDGLTVLFQIDPKRRMQIKVDGVEAQGGAIAGGLGLPAAQRFYVHARVEGSASDTGTVDLVTESGPLRPVVANGAWSRQGASLDARMLLAASALTKDYAARAGPEARLSLRARQVRGDLFQVEGSAVGQFAAIRFSGPLDWRKRSTSGLTVDVALAKFQSWVSDVHAGPMRYVGTVSGDMARWRFPGRVQLERLDQYGYRLGRVSGTATLSHVPGDFRLQGDFAGVGGAGDGLLPTLFGPTPKMKLDGSRLRGGRLLVRDLHLDGAGLQLDAAGDRSILGVLSFKGGLKLSRLERTHAGAKGTVSANWTARQRGREPWNLVFDAKGDGFATGYPEADRLLGPAPRLAATATWGDAGLTFAKSELTGSAVHAATVGRMGQDGALALDVTWDARGPFGVGPFEVAGEAKGTGKVGGRFSAPSVDLVADLASLDAGRLVVKPAHLTLTVATEGGLVGQVAVDGPTQWGPARARSRFRFVDGGLDLDDLDADAGGVKASGSVALRDGAPSTADLTLAVGPGAFLAKGRLTGVVKIQERPGGAAAQINLDGADLAMPGMAGSIRTLRLRADGPWSRLPFQLALDGAQPTPWRFAGDGTLTQSGAGAALTREISLSGAARVRQADIRLTEPAVLRFAGDDRSVRLRASVGKGSVALDGRQTGQTVEAKGVVTRVDLASFAAEYLGNMSASLTLNGQGQRLNGVLEAAVEEGRDRDAPAEVALSGQVRAVLADTRVRIDASATNSQGLTSKLDLDVPAEATAAPFRVALIRNQPVNGSFSAQGELRPLWDLFAGGGRTLSGRGSTKGTLGGTLNRLRASGDASLEGGRFQDSSIGLDLQNFVAQATFGGGRIDVSRFAGDDGRGGSLSGSGEISFEAGASALTLQLQRFRMIDNDVARASASGTVNVTRDAAGKAQLKGTLTIDRADITAKPPVPNGVIPLDVIEINRPGRDDLEPVRRVRGPQIALDVTIRAARGVFVRGNGLDAELSLQAHVGGDTGAPDLTGLARVVRGDYQFAGKRFEFDERSNVRLGTRPEAIRLNLIATREDPALRAEVRITGTAARPEIMLSSTPVLPQDEVLSQVLFGRSASQLSPLEAAQLASAVTALATGGGFDVLGGLGKLAGLDRLAISGGGAAGAAVVSGGKYVTDDVYLELTGGGRNGPTAQVEWRVRRNFSLVSTVGSQGSGRLSIRFRKNY